MAIFRIYKRIFDASGNMINESYVIARSKGAATRKVNFLKQFDASLIRSGKLVSYEIVETNQR